MKKQILTIFLTALVFTGCASLKKDISIGSGNLTENSNLKKIEAMIVPLEAPAAMPAAIDARSRQNQIVSARQMISGFEREASADADYSAKLVAWSGRLSLVENRYSEAQRLYRQSNAASPGNVPAIVLGARLEGDPEKRLELIDREIIILSNLNLRATSGYVEFQIERGRCLFELNRFSEAAGAFDNAFSAEIGTLYRDNYRAERDRAWELRNTNGVNAGTMNMLRQGNVTWNDCITITKNETQLLRFLTGGRDIQNTELFSRLAERAFIPYTQDISINEWSDERPGINETVTRAGAAWFVWHLYAEARADRRLLTRYSSRYATGANPRSPIPDVPALSPFFDSILGSVEMEFISLPDGRNFRPSQEIRASELLVILIKIDN